jgi:hypothetical protein
MRNEIEGNLSIAICLMTALIIVLALSGCVSREEINAKLWLSSGIQEDICEKYPEIKRYGFYRKLNDGRYEIMSYCAKSAKKQISMLENDLNAILDKTLPKGP